MPILKPSPSPRSRIQALNSSSRSSIAARGRERLVGVVVGRDRRAEHGHDPVAHVGDERAAVVEDRVAHLRQVAVEHVDHLLRVAAPRRSVVKPRRSLNSTVASSARRRAAGRPRSSRASSTWSTTASGTKRANTSRVCARSNDAVSQWTTQRADERRTPSPTSGATTGRISRPEGELGGERDASAAASGDRRARPTGAASSAEQRRQQRQAERDQQVGGLARRVQRRRRAAACRSRSRGSPARPSCPPGHDDGWRVLQRRRGGADDDDLVPERARRGRLPWATSENDSRLRCRGGPAKSIHAPSPPTRGRRAARGPLDGGDGERLEPVDLYGQPPQHAAGVLREAARCRPWRVRSRAPRRRRRRSSRPCRPTSVVLKHDVARARAASISALSARGSSDCSVNWTS